jgi:hypothetical protein
MDPRILNLGTSQIERSASPFGRFTPGERGSVTHWTRGWVGPRTGLDNVQRRKILPYRDLNSDLSAVQPVASCYTDCAILAWCKTVNVNSLFIIS